MCNIICHGGIANQSNNEMYLLGWLESKANNKCWQGWVELKPSHIAGRNVKWESLVLLEKSLVVSQMANTGSSHVVNIGLSHDPGIPLLGMCPREIKTYAHTKTYIKMFIRITNNSQKVERAQCPTTYE